MAKNISQKDPHDEDEVHLKVESWRWETNQRRWTWKTAFVLAILLAVALLFAFGFLIVAGVVLIVAIIINLALFFLRKLL